MDDLVQWLSEILDTDEEWARAAADEYGSVWTANVRMQAVTSDTGADIVTEPFTPLDHIAEYDPARVLREIDAKRDLLRLAERAHDYHETFTSGFASALEGTLRLFALAYADRPGYREEWRP